MTPLNLTFTSIFALGFLALFVTEIVGVIRKSKGDTITENWRYVDKRLHGVQQWGWRVMTAGLLVWTLIHLPGTSGW